MEDNTQRKNKFQQYYASFRSSFFNIMFELLKEKNTGVFLGCFIMLVMFIQIIGLIFDPDKFHWQDEFFLYFVVQLCNYCRLLPAITSAGSLFFYYFLLLFGVIYILTMIGLLFYMNWFLKNRNHYVETVVKLLRIMILLLYWIFYMPFFESFISILNCNEGYHYLDKSLQCFQGIHIFYFVVAIIFLVLLFLLNIITAMLYNETQPVQEDCLSRLESSLEVVLVIYRSIVATFTAFCGSEVCSWVIISVFIISSAMLCYQYYKTIPYYNQFVSIFCGSIIFTYFWISINALLMKLIEVNGHIIIIFVGIPLISYLVMNLREKRIENLMKTNIDKLKLDIDALIQVHNMTDFSKGIQKDQTQRMTMIGLVNLHIIECQNADCPCKDEYELYDVATSQFSDRNRSAPHQDEVFLNHFIKRLYEDALNKFINSPSIHIAFAYYLFKVMRNIHASLVELNIAIKKKPSLQQQFTIFRYKNIIEDYIKQDHQEHKYVFPELTNVIEFERLFGEMQKAIEKVCNLQVEFWTHLTTVVPDLNILNDLGKKIYTASQEADFFWNQLSKINPNYQQALNLYGDYLKEIRNHEHLGNTYIERAYNTMNAKKSVDDHAKSSDILFSEDTTVLHISGNKESIGKILKTSQGLSKVFGYSKTEVIGHSINILMPTLFAKKHTDFMERFFRTGRQIIFYNERHLFATHRNGYCFQMKILVKQMPSLVEGIQYVGMIKPLASDYDYILTDLDGVIDSFSKGITNLLSLNPNLFKDKDSQINIQLLAPELISFFLETQQKGRAAKSKFRDQGGETLTLIVPKDFHIIAKSETKQNPGRGGRNRSRSQNANNRNRSSTFKQFIKALQKPKKLGKDRMPSAKQVLSCPEYVNNERKKDVICEITCLDIKAGTNDSMKLLIFKFSKNEKGDKKKQDEIGQLMMVDFGLHSQANDDAPVDYNQFKQITEESNVRQLSGSEDGNAYDNNARRVQFQENDTGVRVLMKQSQQFPAGESYGILKPIAVQENVGKDAMPVQSSLLALDKNQFQFDNNNSAGDMTNKSKGDSNSKSSSDRQSSSQQQEQEEEKKNNQDNTLMQLIDQTNLSTPRQDLSMLKLESAQKEKESFLEDLKKQSFIMSETSTQKMEIKDGMNLNEQSKQEKRSFEQQNMSRDIFQRRSQSSSIQQEPEKMVKKENLNNLVAAFGGDENEEMPEEESFDDYSDNAGQGGNNGENSDQNDDKSQNDSQNDQQPDDDGSQQDQSDEDNDGSEDGSQNDDNDDSQEGSNNSGDDAIQAQYKQSKTGDRYRIQIKDPENRPLIGMPKQTSLRQQYQQQYDQSPNLSDIRFQIVHEEENDDASENIQVQQMRNQAYNYGNSVLNQGDFSKIDNISINGGNLKRMVIQKRDTKRIKTNIKYKCVDEQSEDENEPGKDIHDDEQGLSSKELEFRETILKHEKKRRRKERRQKEKEQKKVKALNGEEGSTEGKKTTAGADDEDAETGSSNSSSEETKDAPKTSEARKAKEIHIVNDEGEVSSVTTIQSKAERNHYILRMAIDEKYLPSSIQNLRFAAYIIFGILLLLAVVYYVIQNSLYGNINQNIKNIHNSESRLNQIIDITLRTRTLILMNNNYLNLTEAEKATLLDSTITELREAATNLKNSQTDLALRTADLSKEEQENINPTDVELLYKSSGDMPTSYFFSIWEAIMEIVVSAYRISTMELSQITDDNPTCYFVIQNCLNSVLKSLKSSTESILNESEKSRQFNMSIFMYLLIAASCSLFVSLVFLVPVINKVKKNKQEVLELFTHKAIEKHIDEQLKLCRNFVQGRLQQNNEGGDQDMDGEDGNMNVNDKELQNELNNTKYMKRIKKKNKGKKWKKLNTNFGSTLLKFFLFICIIEGYYLAMYLLSYKFLDEVQQLTNELKLLISRQPTQSFLLLIQKELIYKNGTSLIEGELSIKYVPTYQDTLYDQEEELLDKFSQNFDYHSLSYNEEFNNIIYSNVCNYVNFDDKTICESFNQGILQKGIYSSVIKYWDFLRQLNHDFLESNRNQTTIKNFLNDQRLKTAERMQDYYFKLSLNMLVSKLEDDIDNLQVFPSLFIRYSFSIEYIQNRTIFIIYVIYIVFLYILIWRKFVNIMQTELWKTKSMLSVLPTKLCFEIEEIRYFIYGNSSNDFLSTKF